MTLPGTAPIQRVRQQEALEKAIACFEESPFNTYTGPDKPELLIITSSAATFYCREAIDSLRIEARVGLLKLGTTWPLPPRLLEKTSLFRKPSTDCRGRHALHGRQHQGPVRSEC